MIKKILDGALTYNIIVKKVGIKSKSERIRENKGFPEQEVRKRRCFVGIEAIRFFIIVGDILHIKQEDHKQSTSKKRLTSKPMR